MRRRWLTGKCVRRAIKSLKKTQTISPGAAGGFSHTKNADKAHTPCLHLQFAALRPADAVWDARCASRPDAAGGQPLFSGVFYVGAAAPSDQRCFILRTFKTSGRFRHPGRCVMECNAIKEFRVLDYVFIVAPSAVAGRCCFIRSLG